MTDREKLNKFAAALGLTLLWDTEDYLPEGCLYAKGRIAAGAYTYTDEVGCDEREILHEIAHFVVAKKSDRKRRNYGLGRADFAQEPNPPEGCYHDPLDEECIAVQVEVLLARDLFGEDYALVTEERTNANPSLSPEETAILVRRKVLNRDGSWGKEVTMALGAVNAP